MGLLGPLAGLVIVGYSIYWLYLQGQKTHRVKTELFINLANKYGLKHRSDRKLGVTLNYMSGVINNFPVTIYENLVGHGKNRQIVTHVIFNTSPLTTDFIILQNKLLNKAYKKKVHSKIVFNDPVIDKKLLIYATQEQELKSYLEPLKPELIKLQEDLLGKIENKGAMMTYVGEGAYLNQNLMEKLERIILFMTKVMES